MTALQINERAAVIADRLEERADVARIAVRRLGNGCRVIDAGIEAPGGYEAGLALAEICMGGLGRIAYTPVAIAGEQWPGVLVTTDHPAVACMASQYAGWIVQVDKYFAMGSGPLRAHARVEGELFRKLGYSEHANRGVLVLETRNLPTDEVASWLGAKARLAPANLTLVAAPTASIAGGVQISARVLETGMHKLAALEFDVTRVVAGIGTAPLAPVAKTDVRAIGRTNDCILYGGQAHYLVRATDAELESITPRLPAMASRDYGTPFYETFKRYNGDFYKIDPLLFSPAEVWLTSTESGKTHHSGSPNPDVLRTSLWES
ncbi:MAG TPA: methenyltetrahydromethanopterin cyclohydrolase [Gemmatimonadales bacterium]|nr:methenyltetrahydromethanopterin cyclohydrolase [Gemmatimonadales bacterium]